MDKRILIINRNCTSNLGDQKIAQSMKKLFSSQGVHVDMAEYSNYRGHKEIVKKSYKQETDTALKKYLKKCIIFFPRVKEIKWKLDNKRLFDSLMSKNYDYIIFGGGELIQSNTQFPIAFNSWVKKINKYQKRTKIILFSVGVTNNFSSRNKKLFQIALKSVTKIYVRDSESQKNMKKIFDKNSEVIPDIVFFNEHNENLENKKNLILYGITSYQRINKYGLLANSLYDYYNDTLNEIKTIKAQHPQYEIQLFYTSQEDYDACVQFKKYAESSIILSLTRINSLEDLHRFCKVAKFVYSPRMHGCIIAALEGCKIIPIKLSPKIITFEKTYLPVIEYEKMKKILFIKSKEVINL